ncbi:hypothetical protein GCM10008939_33730 [Deinococcus aquiradiocola]|uniref:Uncharacterized protein n=1 Tax=Deinococcus aquiradiocola TaxID=393059 RepID=A0A917PQ17_9DEIO|nr:hypothetical protein GCM10008939_33730 [Deinococcus aquiradiocola]
MHRTGDTGVASDQTVDTVLTDRQSNSYDEQNMRNGPSTDRPSMSHPCIYRLPGTVLPGQDGMNMERLERDLGWCFMEDFEWSDLEERWDQPA